jgi:hypothetical protein
VYYFYFFKNIKRIRVSGFWKVGVSDTRIRIRYRYAYPYPCNLAYLYADDGRFNGVAADDLDDTCEMMHWSAEVQAAPLRPALPDLPQVRVSRRRFCLLASWILKIELFASFLA